MCAELFLRRTDRRSGKMDVGRSWFDFAPRHGERHFPEPAGVFFATMSALKRITETAWAQRHAINRLAWCISNCEAFQRNTQLQFKAISPPVALDLAAKLTGYTALGKNAAEASS